MFWYVYVVIASVFYSYIATTYTTADQMSHETITIVCDYIRYRLARANYEWLECPTISDLDHIRLALRHLAIKIEQTHRSDFIAMVARLNITPESLYDSFITVSTEIFNEPPSHTAIESINWGRICSLFTLTGLLAVYCAQNNMEDMLGRVADWLVLFTMDRLRPWILLNGGWVSYQPFVNFS